MKELGKTDHSDKKDVDSSVVREIYLFSKQEK